MNNLKEYLIPFIGLKIGKHQFDYQLDNTFFAHFDYDEFNEASIKGISKLYYKVQFSFNY